MATISKQIQSADEVICRNIESLADQRALLSQNILSQLRNLVEGVIVLLHTGSPNAEFNYDDVNPALAFIKSQGKLNFLGKFHRLLQKSVSHYSPDEDASERLMLKYYEYLHRVRSLLQDNCGVSVLRNLETFPVDLDPSLQEYHKKISARIEAVRSTPPDGGHKHRYYIHKTIPFFVGARIYYEVTFYRAIDKVNKFDRIIAFTDIDINDKYAALLLLRQDSIEVLGQTLPITIIREWEVSIRPCEFNNFARLFGITIGIRTNSEEYHYLMHGLTANSGSLLDLIDMPDDNYARIKAAGTAGIARPLIFPMLDKARNIARSAAPGGNVIRYLMLRMHNQILKSQYDGQGCDLLSGMKLRYGCIPFDTMPFCTSPIGHKGSCPPKKTSAVKSMLKEAIKQCDWGDNHIFAYACPSYKVKNSFGVYVIASESLDSWPSLLAFCDPEQNDNSGMSVPIRAARRYYAAWLIIAGQPKLANKLNQGKLSRGDINTLASVDIDGLPYTTFVVIKEHFDLFTPLRANKNGEVKRQTPTHWLIRKDILDNLIDGNDSKILQLFSSIKSSERSNPESLHVHFADGTICQMSL